jgi:hypothetical protein
MSKKKVDFPLEQATKTQKRYSSTLSLILALDKIIATPLPL